MSDDSRRVLELLAQGKISVEEADQLLAALASPNGEPHATAEGSKPRPRFIRIAVHELTAEGSHEDVNIRVPLAIVRGGMKLGALIPGFSPERLTRHLRAKGIDLDFANLDPDRLDAILNAVGNFTIDVKDGKSEVRISCE
jgi:SHOCT-like protein